MRLKIMTTNLRYGTAKDGEHVWPNRRPVMFDMLRQVAPDVFGVQEALRFQLDELIEALPGYACFGEGREGLEQGEHSAIFYSRERIHCLASGNFWISETPEIPASQSWETSLARMASWGRFQVKETQAPFYLFNTHLDHRSELARAKGAELIWSRVRDLQETTFITGDFNCTEESHAWRYLTGELEDAGDFTDAWHAAETQKNPVSTFHGYKGPNAANMRIDWILMRPQLRVLQAETVVFERDGTYPSDHFAVYAEVEIPDEHDED